VLTAGLSGKVDGTTDNISTGRKRRSEQDDDGNADGGGGRGEDDERTVVDKRPRTEKPSIRCVIPGIGTFDLDVDLATSDWLSLVMTRGKRLDTAPSTASTPSTSSAPSSSSDATDGTSIDSDGGGQDEEMMTAVGRAHYSQC